LKAIISKFLLLGKNSRVNSERLVVVVVVVVVVFASPLAGEGRVRGLAKSII
jgi:hypothetical protein